MKTNRPHLPLLLLALALLAFVEAQASVIRIEAAHRQAFPVMAPQVDQDGIDLAGVRMPEVAVPLATYTGWNPRDPKTVAPEQLVDFAGSYIPFAKAKAERERTGDPRLSLEERYTGRAQYPGLVAEAGVKLIKGGYLLAEDLPALIERAGQQWDYAVK